MAPVNTQDMTYQVSSKYKPDKTETWAYACEEDGWMHAHNALRGELRTFKEACQAVHDRKKSLTKWQVQAIQKAFVGHYQHVEGHHSNEDEIMAPALKERFNYPSKLESDHEGLMNQANKVKKIVENLSAGDSIDELLREWKVYEDIVLPHLKEEEEIGLPLYHAYFTQEEGNAMEQAIIKRITKFEMGSFIYFCGIEKFRQKFMPQAKIPFFVWYLEFSGMHSLFVREWIKNVDALKTGVEPKAASSDWSCTIL